ncbi:oligopeptide transport system ATP-binding protein [Rhizobiales bacterium GAS191]|nr:oligopeptide transport system ATP-binding protein [Rhizobiales bacterium GAS191]
MSRILLRADALERVFFLAANSFGRGTALRAVDDVSLTIERGETLGIVGESGCGKSTLGRLLLRLIEPTGGSVEFDGVNLTRLRKAELRRLRARMQMVFQDPYSSLDPRYSIGASLKEPYSIHRRKHRGASDHAKPAELLEMVSLSPKLANAYPYQLSGGQLQRVSIARALALSPELIVFDEPTASLDVSIQGQIVRLLERLRGELRLTYVFISHNMPLVRYLADRIAVMYLGRIVELLPTPQTVPVHHYSRELMSSVFDPDPTLRRKIVPLAGEPPSPLNTPPGCAFADRCAAATDRCRRQRSALIEVRPGHLVACHHPQQ